MSAMPPPTTTQQQQPTATQAPAPTQQMQQGLPPTGLQQQLTSMNQMYAEVQGAEFTGEGHRMRIGGKFNNIGYDVRAQQATLAQEEGLTELDQANQQGVSGGSLDSMARNMAQRYGMAVGRGRLVDESGNFLYTPKQLADASGGTLTMGEAAANMNYISQALTKKQNEKQQALGLAAIQTGLGQVQERGRGSLATMQTGQYEAMADLYANQEYESADFSYFIQKEQQDIATQLQRNAQRAARKQAQANFWTGIAISVIGFASGSLTVGAAGATQAASSAETSGYF